MKKYVCILFLAALMVTIVPASAAETSITGLILDEKINSNLLTKLSANPECGYTIQLKNAGTKNAVIVSKLTKYNANGIKIRADVWVRYYVKGKSNPYFVSWRKHLGAYKNSVTWSYKVPYAYRAGITDYTFVRE